MKNVLKLLMMVLIVTLFLYATACGPQAQLKTRGQRSAEWADTGLTGAKNEEGREYVSFTPDLEREVFMEHIPQRPDNISFSQNISSVKAEISEKNLKVVVKWKSIEKPLVFEGPLTPKNHFYVANLRDTTNQRNDLSLAASCADTECTIINAFIQDREDHRAGLMIRKEERVLKLKIPDSQKQNVKLLPPEKQAAFAEAEKGRKVTLTSTEIINGISDFEVRDAKGTIKGDVTDTGGGDQKTVSEGNFTDLGKIELIGSNPDKGNIFLKVSNEVEKKAETPKPPGTEKKPGVFDRILGKDNKPKEEKKPEEVQEPGKIVINAYLTTEPRTEEQKEKRKVQPKPLLPTSSKVIVPKTNLSTAATGATKVSGTIDPLVQQILMDAENEEVKKYINKNVIAIKDPSGKFVKKNFEVDLYLACHNGDTSLCKRDMLGRSKSESVKKMVEVLRTENFPAAITAISLIESGLEPARLARPYLDKNGNYVQTSAFGWWQFIDDTARRYGLTLLDQTHKDQRADVKLSTQAATKYLKDLLKLWNDDIKMAVVSYYYGEANVQCAFLGQNAGIKSRCKIGNLDKELADLKERYEISEEVAAQKFWDLYKNRMIKNTFNEKKYGDYVIKFLAYNIVSFNPKEYGYEERDPLELY